MPGKCHASPIIVDKDFELFASTDGTTWNEPVLKGTFKDTADLQSFLIDKTRARYFKLVGLSGYTRNAAAVGEISFFGTPVAR